jgi:hypothetical protein
VAKGKGKNNGPDIPRAGAGSAKAIITQFLDQFGLGELGTWAWEQWLKGDEIDEIFLALREQPAYKERFPAMDQLSKEGRAITEQEYQFYEQTIAQRSKQWGIPDGIYNNPEAIAQMLINDVSTVEFESRVRRAASLVYSDPNILQAFSQFYGTQGDGAAIAYLLDPEQNEPKLAEQYAAAQVAGNVMAQGVGAVSQAQAEMIARRINPTDEQAAQAALQVGNQRDLYGQLFGERKAVDVDTATSAAFGADSADQLEVDAARRRRAAAYSTGGGVASNQSGLTGLGSANT